GTLGGTAVVKSAPTHRDPRRHGHRVRGVGIDPLPLGARLIAATDARSSSPSAKKADTDPSSDLGQWIWACTSCPAGATDGKPASGRARLGRPYQAGRHVGSYRSAP